MTTIPLDFLVATDELRFARFCAALVDRWLARMEGPPKAVAAYRPVMTREVEGLLGCTDWSPMGVHEGMIPYTYLLTADVLVHQGYLERRTVVVNAGLRWTRLEYKLSAWGRQEMEGYDG